MPDCIRCKSSFKMPKGRTKCYLCPECRSYAVYSEPKYLTEGTTSENLSSYFDIDVEDLDG